MPKFAANLSMMFNEVPFLDRFAAARDAGFQAVEYLFPYEYEPEVVGRKLRENHLENVLFNMPPGNWSTGERGIASLPGREEEFRAGVEKALAYAAALGVTRLHAMAGIPPAGAVPAACRATLIENLKYAAGNLAPHNITLLLEAINTRDMPGFFVSTQAYSFAICSAVNAPNLKAGFIGKPLEFERMGTLCLPRTVQILAHQGNQFRCVDLTAGPGKMDTIGKVGRGQRIRRDRRDHGHAGSLGRFQQSGVRILRV